MTQLPLATDPRLGQSLGGNAPATVELLVRVALSLPTTPGGHIPSNTDTELRAWAQATLPPIIHSHLSAHRPEPPDQELQPLAER